MTEAQPITNKQRARAVVETFKQNPVLIAEGAAFLATFTAAVITKKPQLLELGAFGSVLVRPIVTSKVKTEGPLGLIRSFDISGKTLPDYLIKAWITGKPVKVGERN